MLKLKRQWVDNDSTPISSGWFGFILRSKPDLNGLYPSFLIKLGSNGRKDEKLKNFKMQRNSLTIKRKK